jgi:carbamoyl-phosphate synthase small subunit
MASSSVRAVLALEDGLVFEGRAFGRQGESTGEVVFNTALCGYQEVLTDPSYAGQIVTMTYPHIGNYGINVQDVESARPQVAGFVVREVSTHASSWRASGELDRYLDEAGIVGISDIDTRALTRHLRTHGAQRGVVSSVEGRGRDELVDRARGSRSMVGLDLAREVTTAEAYAGPRPEASDPFRVVAYDFGLKQNILRMLAAAGCEVTVVPAGTSAGDALVHRPDGVFLSNGPGDPEPVDYAIEACREFMERRVPLFGICLGHQILGLACGGSTFKLKFGHRGANHPVKNLRTGQVEITSQNHGFSVDPKLFDRPELELTHVNLNDGTVEGFRHRELPVSSVQYHPEASPGPHDSHYLFADFVDMMRRRER